MLRFKAAYVSGPPSGRVRVRRDEGGELQGILPFTISEVLKLERPGRRAEPEPVAEPQQGEQESLLDIAVDHMVGHGPAAHQVWLPPLDVPDTLDELMPDLVEDPRARPGLAGVARARRARRAARHRRPAARAAPRHPQRSTSSGAAGHVAVVGGPRSGKSTAAAHGRREHGADDDAAGVAVLRARLRRRHVLADGRAAARRRRRHPLRARRRPPDRRRGDRRRRPARGVLPRQRHRLDRDLPLAARPGPGRRRVRRRVPRRRRLEHAARRLRRPRAGDPAAGHPRPHLRPAPAWRRAAAGPTSAPRCATCSAPGSSCGSATRSTPRSTAGSRRWCRPAGPAAAWCRASCTSSPRCRGSTATPTPDTLGDGVDDLVKRVSAAWTGPPGPKLRLLPERIDLDDVRAQAGVPAGPTEHDALLLGINEKELAPVGLDPDDRAAPAGLRRRAVRQERDAARPDRARSCAPARRSRRSSSSSTTGASLLGEVPDEYLLNYLTSATQASPRSATSRRTSRTASPAPTSPPTSCATGRGGPAPRCSSLVDDYDLVATQQSSPVAAAAAAARPGPRRRPARGRGATLRRRLAGALRAVHPVAARPGHARPDALRQPRRGLADRQPQAAAPASPAAAASGTRERGVEVVQVAWTDPTL